MMINEGMKKYRLPNPTTAEDLEMGGKIKAPKALGVPGVHSCLYPIFVRFGVIEVCGSGAEHR